MSDSVVADLVLLGGTVETVTSRPAGSPAPEAVAVAGDRIVAVGAAADVEGLIGPASRVVRLHGETVLPGFQDAHIHPIYGGLLAFQCNLHALGEEEAYLDAVRAYAGTHPAESWIQGDGWRYAPFPGGRPRREALDRVVPDRPVFLTAFDGHSAWVNSRALELARIGADTPDPPHGRIDRDPDGSPTGLLAEDAQRLVSRLIPQPTPDRLMAALLEAQRHLHALGITAWQDAGANPEWLSVYRTAAADGRLTARVTVAQQWRPWGRDPEPDPLPRLVADRDGSRIGRLRADVVKYWLDGVIENGTAALLDPYLQPDGSALSGDRGILNYDDAELASSVIELERRGFDVHFHAIGDRAVRQGLDAFASARATNGQRDARHSIAHLELVDPADVPRFARLGVAANIQPRWAHDEPEARAVLEPAIGERRYHTRYAFGDLLRAGARLAGGSDWSVTSANPLEEIEVAIRRADPFRRDDLPWRPDQSLDLDGALAAFTIGSAWVNRLETETGTIEVGKLADMVILDRDLRRIPDGAVAEGRVTRTLVGGEEVWVG